MHRIINVLKIWIEYHFSHFDKISLEKLCKYIEGLVIPRQVQWGKMLQELIRNEVLFPYVQDNG